MLPTVQTTKEIDGVNTEVLIQNFADRVLVLVTQLGKVGNLIQATIPSAEPLLPPAPAEPGRPSLPAPPASIQLMPVLGQAPSEHFQTLHSLYASQVATLVWNADATGPLQEERRAVIVGIALRKSDGTAAEESLSEQERTTFFEVMGLVQELLARR
ncbi:hypothetical protein NM688_g6663 [Phlebia brevispora]|uniref:Uncharacterized protein n=1 Tax=Phlebia brevispora TaxID=194682 RepID=A0ACC1SDP7_9APHY|nr:hypothetical protein NM688_g6663 [Phlebia brevispora]